MFLRLKVTGAFFILMSLIIFVQLIRINTDNEVAEASLGRGKYVISNVSEYGLIYDRNGKRLVNETAEYYALIDPTSTNALKVLEYVADKDVYRSGMNGNLPFLCRVTKENVNNGITVFRKYKRNSPEQKAVHVIGYTSDDVGVCGVEKAYDDFIRSNYSENYAEFNVNAIGEVLKGLDITSEKAEPVTAGVVTTLDSDIQQICEESMEKFGIKKGAVVVMDVKSGELLACASYPTLNPDNLAPSLDDEDSPFINRAFSSYSVGSIFKLCTAAAALESGIISDFTYTCTGSVNVNGQIFNCHKWGGHGEIDMLKAMEVSCNPYFIALSEYVDSEVFVETAEKLGFGSETVFAEGMVSSSGYLPNVQEIAVPAEKGNMSFGQGKLSATPIQICRMTATIANNGMCSEPRLIKGIKYADGSYEEIKYPVNKRSLSYLTVRKLRDFMTSVVNAENSLAASYVVSSGGKTSTAQTARYNPDGTEELNCWFTGYFPSDIPEYAVTVLAENGISGNVTSSPIYKEIAERITLKKGRTS